MAMRKLIITMVLAWAFVAGADLALGQCPGLRVYYDYPYAYSWGTRYDPYWSYTTSRYPDVYQGDGSYYGLGYSGYYGRDWYGSYWYW